MKSKTPKPTISELIVGEVRRYERMAVFFLTVPYIIFVAGLDVVTWLKLVLIVLNPMTLRTAVMLWVKRDVLEMAYWMFYAAFESRRGAVDEKRVDGVVLDSDSPGGVHDGVGSRRKG